MKIVSTSNMMEIYGDLTFVLYDIIYCDPNFLEFRFKKWKGD